MSSEIAIDVDGAGKAYALFDRPEDRLKQMVFAGRRTYQREFWALQPTSFTVRTGETVGIIGRNGSGKSTILQMICGNLQPSVGKITVSGKVAALLELGAGFNPEFSGLENVYINGALAGYSRTEIDDRLDAILSFADIGPFISQAVKTYSSGMFARLAFSVAVAVEPDILIVDEALSVGDEAFQRKCFARMERIRNNGATILFVSHATTTIVDLCDRAILLHRGEHLYTGTPKRTVAWYQKLMAAPEARTNEILDALKADNANVHPQEPAQDSGARKALAELGIEKDTSFADMEEQDHFDPSLKSTSSVSFEINGAEIEAVSLERLDGTAVNTLSPGQCYRLRYRARFDADADSVKFYCMIKTVHGVHIGGGSHPDGMDTIERVASGSVVEVQFDFTAMLSKGLYFFNCGVTSRGDLLHRILDVVAFRVQSGTKRAAIGTVDLSVVGTARALAEPVSELANDPACASAPDIL